ncbi:MAG: hypothetical protein JXR34_03670 [Bacteroidales bacterium]|nr:hypothetical protein [Bacteroidales bacterium]
MTLKRTYLLSICFLLVSYFANGQAGKSRFDFLNIESLYYYGALHQVDVGFSLTNNFGASIFTDIFYYGPSLNLGYGFALDNNTHLLHSSLGYEFCGYFLIFMGRATLNNYTNFSDNQMTFKPEVGLTFMGLINLTYGYNFSLNRNDPFGIAGHYIGLDLHFQLKDLN